MTFLLVLLLVQEKREGGGVKKKKGIRILSVLFSTLVGF